MTRRKQVRFLIGILCIPILLFALGTAAMYGLRTQYLHRVEHALLALAQNPAATRTRVAAIHRRLKAEEIDKRDGEWTEQWFDGQVGLAKDGYVFYYDMHNPHTGTYDLLVGDINVFYLPDERRFRIYRKHFCCDLYKMEQPASKAELLVMLEGTW